MLLRIDVSTLFGIHRTESKRESQMILLKASAIACFGFFYNKQHGGLVAGKVTTLAQSRPTFTVCLKVSIDIDKDEGPSCSRISICGCSRSIPPPRHPTRISEKQQPCPT